MTGVLLGPLTAGTSSADHLGPRPISFFSAEPSLASAPDPNAPMREIKRVVQALHDAGLEAILQVGLSSSFANSVLMGAQQYLEYFKRTHCVWGDVSEAALHAIIIMLLHIMVNVCTNWAGRLPEVIFGVVHKTRLS